MTELIAFLINIVLVVQSIFSVNINDAFLNKKNEYTDISYGSHTQQKLDLYLPEHYSENEGLMLFIHGGSWDHGSKEAFAKKCKTYRDKGYVTASVNYRLVTDGASAKDMMNDISAGMKKIRQTAKKVNINIDKVMLVGLSAGAHLSLLYAYTCADSSPIKVTAVVAYCPPSDLYDNKMYTDTGIGSCSQMVKTMSTLCGKKFTYETKSKAAAELKGISPYYNVSEKCVPTLFCHGKFDGAVPFSQSASLKMKLDSYDVPNDFVIFPNSTHSLAADPDKTKEFNKYFNEYAFIYLS